MNANRIRLYTAIGETIRDQRVKRGVTRTALGERIGMSKAYLAKIEEGVQPCPIHALVAIADAFDLTLDELVPVLTEGEVAA